MSFLFLAVVVAGFFAATAWLADRIHPCRECAAGDCDLCDATDCPCKETGHE